MNWFESDTRNFDGSYKHYPPIIQRLPSEEVSAEWQPPADVTELLDRVYPNGAPEMWVKFFGGEEIEEAEREKIRVALKGHARKPSDSGSIEDQILLGARQEIERGLQELSWLDAASEEDHEKIVRQLAGRVSEKISERAALEMRKRSLDYLFELRGDEIRTRLHRSRDWHVLYLLAESIVAPGRHTGFPDEYRHLLPAETVKRIELYRALEARRAEEAKAAEEARRAEEAAQKERELAERMAFIETASFDDLLDLLFKPDSSILNSFRRREKLTDADLNLLIYLKDTADPVMRRGYERLFELGSSVGVKVLSLEEIEELQATRLREQEEAREREIAVTLRRIEESGWIELCAEAAARGLVPQEWLPWLHRVTDVERVYKVRDHFAACAGRETDPVSIRICELLSERALSRNVGMAGAVPW
jgi:hypothetical protein